MALVTFFIFAVLTFELKAYLALKPASSPPIDLFIGAAVNVFGHQFTTLDTDESVLKYMESNAAQCSPEALSSIQNHVRNQGDPAPELENRLAKEDPEARQPVAHSCNPSNSGSRNQEHHSSKPAWASSKRDPISKKPITKKGWWCVSRYRP
jgi:hypothetical protein